MDIMTQFESFCGGTFWNASLTWGDVRWPEFTRCFQHTLLVWVPCFMLWLTLPLNLGYMYLKRGTPISRSSLTEAKIVMSGILMVLCVAEIAMAPDAAPSYNGTIPDILYVSPAIKIATMVLTITLFYLECSWGFITSGIQFGFWCLLFLFNIVPFYTRIFYAQEEVLDFDAMLGPMIVFYAEFACILVQFILQFKAETLPSTTYTSTKKRPCPEILSSFFSRISFWWMNGVVITGYRKTLEESDLWDLNPRDKSTTTVPAFQKTWKKELDRIKSLNERHPHRTVRLQNSTEKLNEKSPLLPNGVAFHPSSPQPVKTASIFRVMTVLYGPTLMKAFLFKLLYDVLVFVNPQILNLLIAFTEDKSIQEWKGYIYIVAMFLCSLVQSALFHQNFHTGITLGMRIKAAFIAAVYRKSLVMNGEARKTSTVGEIVNLMSVDAQRIQDITGYLWMVISCPFQIAISMVFLYSTLGPSVFAGLGFMLLLMPINAFISYFMKKYQVQQMKIKDSRIKLMNEVLNGIKVLKLYAWEKMFQERITKIRMEEMAILKKLAYISAFMNFIFTLAPYLVTLTTFVTFILTSDSQLDASKAFVALSLFNILRFPMNLLPMIIAYIVQAQVSIVRIRKFLLTGELAEDNVTHDKTADSMLSIKNGTFAWEKDELPVLNNINIEVPRGKLVAVVGTVGSGKSSLMSAFLGEMEKITGDVNTKVSFIKGSLAYVPQQAWIQHATLRDNILFMTEYDVDKYNRVIDACALRSDLAILSNGDMTEIGERGINLSGGQKQRVSLARAVYNDADIYLLDDPLSAVDAHVGKHLYDEVIGNTGLLRDKTRVLVTHGVHWLPLADTVVVMEGGCITEMGSYEDLMKHDGAFATFIHTYLSIDLEEEDADDDPTDIKETKARMLERAESALEEIESSILSDDQAKSCSLVRKRSRIADDCELERSLRQSISKSRQYRKSGEERVPQKTTEKLVQDEKSETGQVSYKVYGAYARAIGTVYSISIVIFFVLFNISQALANIWLSRWTEDPILKNESLADFALYDKQNNYYMGIYGGLGIAQGLFVLLYSCIFSIRQVNAATVLHHGMLANILRSPMSFFDTTPIGRIVNRFSRDIETIDNNLPQMIRQFFNTFFNVITTIVIISVTTPLFLAVILPLCVLYYLIQRFYIPTTRQLKRIESTTRSPVYVHFTETILGASSIRAYDVVNHFHGKSDQHVDYNLVYYFAGICSNRWLGVRLEFVGNILIMAASLFAVIGRDTLSGGLVGLSVSYAMQVTSSLNWMIRVTSDMETNIVSVERVKEYSETPTEAPLEIEDRRPTRDWPEHGTIEFMDYSTRYRPGLDLVLRGLSCRIKPGEKVGIVGRTGAGKSSLTLALFRIIESAGGNIVIDDRTISDMGLHDLRSRLTILPQDPVLFAGTLRMNVDPFNQYTDDQIWHALHTANLKPFVWALPDRLQHECGEGGNNLSLGQRQLICLARTLLKKTRILVLDEATAAVDMETDDLIQQAIRSEFKECTVVTIAHRLNTILDYDRVIVMDKGRIVEFDSPSNLLNQATSIFYGMARDAGLVH